MEGLFIAKILEELSSRLPARNLGWVFPDETTAALLLESIEAKDGRPFNLVLSYRPPIPALYVNRDRFSGGPSNAFQRALESRVKGNLERAVQLKLDRVVQLEFSAAAGFIDLPAARLVFELTGRNANVVMLNPADTPFEGKILSAAREITSGRNRFRQVRLNGAYTPPPPYDKLDPRTPSSTQELKRVLDGVPVQDWHKKIDGLGPSLAREIAFRSQLEINEPITGARLERALAALQDVVRDPSLSGDAADTLSGQARTRAKDEKIAGLRKALREPLEKRVRLLEKQIEDVEKARADVLEAITQREWADALLAFPRDVPVGVSSVKLPNLYGEGEIEIPLDPSMDAIQNANRYYAKARRREEVQEKLQEREPQLLEAKREVEGLLERVAVADEKELERLLATDVKRAERPPVGTRFHTRGGFEVLVGRNSRENEFLTHRLAHSQDLWFHVQGYPGSHTILRNQGREVPFPDVLEAAQIAAYHSKARGSGNVAVDYTPVKSVWKPKGSRAGSVYFSGQKTVFVDAQLPEDSRNAL
jgi:predicted ribosome quality control (RQC) complex YloA/Tae2 family protein